MNELILILINHIRAAWRFRWYAILLAWILALVGWAVVFVMPDKYESNAKVFVDTKSVLRPLLEGLAVQTDLNQRLQLMTRTLLSRENLEEVLRETDMDHQASTVAEHEGLIKKLKEDINIDAQRRQNLYTINYVHKDPYIAQKVVEILVNIFVEQALGDTRVESDTAQKFLKQQINEYESRLIEAENRLTEFKRKNVDTLPSQTGGVYASLREAHSTLENTELELKEAQIRRDELWRQFQHTQAEEEERRQAGQVVAGSAAADQILAMEIRLGELLLKYTHEHPDVKELKSTIEVLKAKEEGKGPVEYDPVVNQPSTALEELKLDYRQSEVTLRAIKLRASEYQKRIDILKQKLDVLPKVEAELARLNRNYDINREKYQQLVERLESAVMSEQAGKAGDNVKFRIIEPPKVPLLPVGPKRLLLSTVILFASFVISGGIAFLLSQLMPVYFDANTLRRETELPVFGQLSRIRTKELAFRRKIEATSFFSAIFLLVLVFGVVLSLYTMELRETVIDQLKQIATPFI